MEEKPLEDRLDPPLVQEGLIGTDLCSTWLNSATSGDRHNHMCPHLTHFASL